MEREDAVAGREERSPFDEPFPSDVGNEIPALWSVTL